MSFTKNSVFYKTFKTRNKNLKLIFIPADTITLSSPTNIELPDDFVLSKVEVNSQMPDNSPVGMELAREMSLELDLTRLQGDFVDVRNWILDVNVRNRWILLSDCDSIDISTVEFDGLQEPPSPLVLSRKSLEVKVIDVVKSALELPFDALEEQIETYVSDTDVSPYSMNKSYFAIQFSNYTNSNKWIGRYQSSSIEQFIAWDVPKLFEYLFGFAGIRLSLITRTTMTFSSAEFSNFAMNKFIDFYKTTNLESYATNGLLHDDEVHLIIAIRNDLNELIGGLLSKKSESSYKDYEAIWDLFKAFAEMFLGRLTFQYELDTSTYNATIKPIFTKIFNTSGVITAYQGLTPLTNLTKTDFSISIGENYISRATAHIRGITAEQPTEYIQKYEGVANEKGAEIELPADNLCRFTEVTNSRNYVNLSEFAMINTFYFYTSSAYLPLWYFTKVHNYCVADLGDGVIINSGDTSSFTWTLGSSADDDLQADYNLQASQLNNLSSYAKLYQKAMEYVWAKPNHLVIKDIELTFEQARPKHIGSRSTIDYSELLGYSLSGIYGTYAIWTNVTTDYVRGTTKLELYVRGV